MKSLKNVNCFKCETLDRVTPAEVLVEYMGVETPICKKCYNALVQRQGREYIKVVNE